MNNRLLPLLTGVVFFCAAAGARAQGKHAVITNWAHSSRNCHHLLSAPAQCKWSFFDIDGKMEGTIVAWTPVPRNDKVLYAASVAIVQTDKDMVRVLCLDNYSNLQVGQHVKVAPDKEPEVDTEVPLDRDFYLSEEQKGARPVCRINAYDNKVLRTTWGRIQ